MFLTKKTLIAILSSHDDDDKNQKLIDLLNEICNDENYKKILDDYWFVFTGGTFERIMTGYGNVKPISISTKNFLRTRTILLPKYQEGGVTILSYLIISKKIKIIWPFFAGLTPHVLVPSNRSLLRLCEIYNVKQLINTGSVKEWLKFEAELDTTELSVDVPLNEIILKSGFKIKTIKTNNCIEEITTDVELEYANKIPTLALIYDADKESETVLFLKTHEDTIKNYFEKILTIQTNSPINKIDTLNEKIIQCRNGHQGGYIEIATEILFDKCDVAIFFLNPLHQHPESDYIQVVLSTGMINEKIRVLTSMKQASDWLDRVAHESTTL